VKSERRRTGGRERGREGEREGDRAGYLDPGTQAPLPCVRDPAGDEDIHDAIDRLEEVVVRLGEEEGGRREGGREGGRDVSFRPGFVLLFAPWLLISLTTGNATCHAD
jgi:hypothetical protein